MWRSDVLFPRLQGRIREQPAQKDFGRRYPAVADVFGAQCLVDPPMEDPADAADAANTGHGLFAGHALRDQGMDAAAHLLGECVRRSMFLTDSCIPTLDRNEQKLILIHHE